MAGEAAAWTPILLPNLQLWLNGATLAGTTGDTITAWTDSSGNGNHATGTATLDTALIGGQRGLTFGGASQAMTGANTLGLSQPLTFIVVAKTYTVADAPFIDTVSGRCLLGSAGGVGTNSIFMFAGAVAFDPQVTESDNTAYYVTAVFNGASSYIRINGSQTNAVTGPGSDGAGTYFLGVYGDAPTVPKNSRICEVIVVSGVISGPNQTLAETYLADKYSL